MTLRLYADRPGLDLTNVTVRVQHSKIHAADCESCETNSGRVDQFERVMSLEGNLDSSGRHRLLEIADRCPVHRTLSGEVTILTQLAE